MRNILISLVLLINISGCTETQDSKSLKLWYNKPAEHFEESLVLGNGKQGATVYGGVDTDIIQLNDITLWSGEPVNANMNPDAYKSIPAIRTALKNEDYKLADSLHRNIQGAYSQSYAPLGTLKIKNQNEGEFENYYRELSLNNAISKTNYKQNGVEYEREYFVSNPNKVIAIKLSCKRKRALNFTLAFESLLNNKVSVNKGILQAKGNAPVHAAPSYLGDIPNAIIYEKNKGTKFAAFVQIKNTDGRLIATDSTIGVLNASEAIIYISLSTSFNGFDKNPATEGANYLEIANQQIKQAFDTDYERLKADHIADYQKYFNRVSLNLGDNSNDELPTNERLKKYQQGATDLGLEVLYFQYGRYLLISSSRTPEVPANLQGLWNPYMRPPWSSNYTMNINAEENYWLAEIGNLPEMHKPFLGFVNNLSKTGRITAKTFYGVNGWCVAHNSDIWALTNPVGNFGEGDPVWANWNMGGVWASTHLWEHFLFNQNINFLKDEAYPLMKGAAQFCLDWLIEDKDGFLITSPCTSPENKFITDNGYEGATFYGGSADIAMIRELFNQIIKAAKILNINDTFTKNVELAYTKLLPYKIGKDGSLQEWYYDWKDADPKHRHQTHLFGLHPGHHITPLKTPELAQACKQALEIKGDETTGWSLGWRINLWARLNDGDRAYKMYQSLLNYVEPDAIRDKSNYRGGTYPNLLDAHPPFQIDGNFGGAAAVIEMLLQSTGEEIYLLPALPNAWPTGEIKGICARGGFEMDLKWSKGKLIKARIISKAGKPCKVIYMGKVQHLLLSKGESTVLKF